MVEQQGKRSTKPGKITMLLNQKTPCAAHPAMYGKEYKPSLLRKYKEIVKIVLR